MGIARRGVGNSGGGGFNSLMGEEGVMCSEVKG